MIRVKALLLLVTFLLNTAIGLNCALQKDDDCCDESTELYQPDLSLQSQSDHQLATTVKKRDACCQDAVNNFASLAKLVPQPAKVFVPVAVACIRLAYQYAFTPVPVVTVSHQLLIDERQRPPTTDVRIAIQSFLI
ncbi:hypothetical protein [Mucilaginibacter sp. FT3.2]|uniref:hypothetical protein n=1 Tax=Mucilaginibacter sp. FT3.2 TaxID=2723090 RepID=UPI00160E9B3B|nr:hypothetical protein [Mucilaginibacter sp. FT3.2]MBB6233873.1 hypothetical protein [Mucilaginibacter sp. FT3.2]